MADQRQQMAHRGGTHGIATLQRLGLVVVSHLGDGPHWRGSRTGLACVTPDSVYAHNIIATWLASLSSPVWTDHSPNEPTALQARLWSPVSKW